MNTYTQANCRQLLSPSGEEEELSRVRYNDETNLDFWGMTMSAEGNVEWIPVGEFTLLGALQLT